MPEVAEFSRGSHASFEKRAQKWRGTFVAAAALGLTILPLLLFLRRDGVRAPLSMFAGDSFYYLTIARNSLHTRFFTFDGSYPTNGFHPLWEILLYLGMKFGLLRPDDSSLTITRVYVFETLVLGATCALFASFAARHLRWRELALFAVCPGFLWFFCSAASPLVASNWSFVNGMESVLEMFFLAAALQAFRPGRFGAGLLTALLLGLMVLSRLDDIFILIPMLLFLWKELDNRSTAVRLWLPAVPLGLILVYLVYNALVVHALFPTSGAVKAGFALNGNWSEIAAVLLPSKGSWVLMQEDRMAGFAERSYRAYLLLVPTLVCAAYLLWSKHRWSLIGMACTGVVLKGLYNLFFVALFNQGFWYFGSSVLIANLVIALWIDRSIGAAWTHWSHVFATYAVAFLLISFSFNAQVAERLTPGGADWEMAILQRGDVIRSLVRASGGDRFIELNDGIITYSTGMTALAGTGLALDVEATRAIQNGNLLSLAAKRDYHLMVAAGSYRTMVDEYLKFRARGFRGYMGQLKGQELDHFKLVPVAHDDPTDLTIYRIVPIP